jgi:hypothetical protein
MTDLVENDVDTLYEEIENLVDHLVENDVDTLHEERIHLVRSVLLLTRSIPRALLRNFLKNKSIICIT